MFVGQLPELYKRGKFLGHDEDRESETTLNELELLCVNIVKLTRTNNFVIKKLLFSDDTIGI